VGFASAIRGSASAADAGSSLAVDAGSFGGLDALAQRAASSGFRSELLLRQRGAGDLALAADRTLVGGVVNVVADQGSIQIAGNIDTRGAASSRVTLSARDRVDLLGAIHAASQNGGEVELRAQTGGLSLGESATIDVSGRDGTAAGQVRYRVSSPVLSDAAAIAFLGGVT